MKQSIIVLAGVTPLLTLVTFIPVVTVGGWAIRPLDVMLLLLIAATILDTRLTRTTQTIALLLAIYALVVVGGALTSYGARPAWKLTVRYLFTLSWALGGTLIGAYYAAFRRMCIVLGIAGAIFGVISAYFYIMNPALQRIAGFLSQGDGTSLKAGSCNEIGALHALAGLTTALIIPTCARVLSKVALYVILSCNIGGLLLTASRSGLLALVTAGLVLALVLFRRKLRRHLWGRVFALGVGLAALCTGLMLAGEVGFSTRLTSSFDNTTMDYRNVADRLTMWQTGLSYIEAHPGNVIVGIGTGQMVQAIATLSTDSYYLDHVISEGVAGIIVLLVIMALPGIRLWRDAEHDWVCGVGIAAVLVAAVVSATGDTLIDPTYGSMSYAVAYGALALHSHGRVRARARWSSR